MRGISQIFTCHERFMNDFYFHRPWFPTDWKTWKNDIFQSGKSPGILHEILEKLKISTQNVGKFGILDYLYLFLFFFGDSNLRQFFIFVVQL